MPGSLFRACAQAATQSDPRIVVLRSRPTAKHKPGHLRHEPANLQNLANLQNPENLENLQNPENLENLQNPENLANPANPANL